MRHGGCTIVDIARVIGAAPAHLLALRADHDHLTFRTT
jgi:hypothetical protein